MAASTVEDYAVRCLGNERLAEFGGIDELISRTFEAVAKSVTLVGPRPTTMPEALRNLEGDAWCKNYLVAFIQEVADLFVRDYAGETCFTSSSLEFEMSMYKAGQSRKKDWVAQPFVIDCFAHAKDKSTFELAAKSLEDLIHSLATHGQISALLLRS
jgi:hypothetical protein